MKKSLSLMLLVMMAFGFISKGAKSFSVISKANAAVSKEITDPPHKGGTLNARLSAWPKSLNYYTGSDSYVGLIWSFTGTSLITKDMDTWEDLPNVAKSWSVGDDKLTYTFKLNPNAKWQDGKPITAHDVKFTIDLLWDEKKCILCANTRSFYGPVEYVKAVDDHTVELKLKKIHFDNLSRFGSIALLPKHKYSTKDFNKGYDKVIYGGGAYMYDKKASKFRKTIVLKRIKNHWTNEYEHGKKDANFDTIVFKHIKDVTVAFEAFKRRELDIFYYELDSFNFWENRSGKPFTDKRLGIVEAEKFNPAAWGGVAFNMRSGPLSDLNFRKAIQYMFNRELIIKKIFKGHLRPVAGPFMYGSKYSAGVKPVPYDIQKAADLIKKAGFEKADDDGILYREIEKDGKKVKERAEFTILYSLETHAQWLTILKEDAKKLGVHLTPRLMEWSAAVKLLDEFKFEGFVIGWSGSPVPGPEQLWHGSQADKNGSSNLSGLNIPELDKLIDAGPGMFSEKDRIKAYHKMEKLIIKEQPYLFRWAQAKHYVTYWKDRVDPTDKPYYKFSGSMIRDPFYTHWRAVKK